MGEVGVRADARIMVEFDNGINASSLNTTNFTVRGQQFGVYPGIYTTPTGNVAVFAAAVDFLFGEKIEVNLSSNVTSAGGQSLRPHFFAFHVETLPCTNALFVDSGQMLDDEDSFDVALGDIDGDGDIDVLDALRAAQIAVGLIAAGPIDFFTCDVDTDGDIDILDALLIAQVATGLPVTLNCP